MLDEFPENKMVLWDDREVAQRHRNTETAEGVDQGVRSVDTQKIGAGKILGSGRGGHMVAAVRTIMDDVRPRNMLAMVDAVEENGYYPVQ